MRVSLRDKPAREGELWRWVLLTAWPFASYRGHFCLILASSMLTCLLITAIGFPPNKATVTPHQPLLLHPEVSTRSFHTLCKLIYITGKLYFSKINQLFAWLLKSGLTQPRHHHGPEISHIVALSECCHSAPNTVLHITNKPGVSKTILKSMLGK